MKGDYNNGRIYFIEPICDHEDNEFYYGSTLQTLSKRMGVHRGDYNRWRNGKRNKVMCFDLFEKYGIENCKIYLVELYPCKSKEELEAREGYYIRNYECVNKHIPGRTRKEYYNDNKDKYKEYVNNNKDKLEEYRKEYVNNNKNKILEYHKEYYNDNKDKIKTKHNVQYKCPCGGRYTYCNKSVHFKSKKHIKYEEEQN